MSNSTQGVRIGEARLKLYEVGLGEQTARRFDEIAARFESFVRKGFGIGPIGDVTTEHIKAFVAARGSSGEPAIATMHIRRCALRALFRAAQQHFDFTGDPTAGLVLPPRSVLSTRPLTDDEVAIGRSFALHSLNSTRLPAAWALGEATATTAELPHIVVADLDLHHKDGPRVWLHGSSKRTPRWGQLDDWGATQLERRAGSLKNTTRLIYSGNSAKEEGQIASCVMAISDTLTRAGLNAEPDVRPASLPAWAGTVVLRETDRIEEVARRLGMGSLDSAASFIGFDWL